MQLILQIYLHTYLDLITFSGHTNGDINQIINYKNMVGGSADVCYPWNIFTQGADDFLVELQGFVPLKLWSAGQQVFVGRQDRQRESDPRPQLVLFQCTTLPNGVTKRLSCQKTYRGFSSKI